MSSRWLLTALVAGITACGDPVSGVGAEQGLTRGLVLPLPRVARGWSEADPTFRLVPAEGERGFWVVVPLERASWKPVQGRAGVWSTARPFLGTSRPAQGPSVRLFDGTRELQALPSGQGAVKQAGEGTFLVHLGVLLARGFSAEPPADEAWEYVDPGTSEEGAWRCTLGSVHGTGFLVAPGLPVTTSARVAGPAMLLFSSSTQGAGGRAMLTILAGGVPVHETELLASPTPETRVHRVLIPDGSQGPLEFRLAGAPVLTGIFEPRLLLVESTASRAPDLVLFIADTFRADNLVVCGGTLALAPELEAFAAGARVFTRAFAPSPWTLPSHAALFSGLYPPQVGVTAPGHALSADVRTLAEVLLDDGYRTVAITDDAFVSPQYGLAQGFEFFDARRRSAEETVAAVRTALEGEDGRPTFLVVHSYRSHHPYVVDETTRETLGTHLRLRPEIDPRDFVELPSSIPGWTPDFRPDPAAAQRMADYRALYRGASADLARLFGAVRRLIEEGGARAHSVLLFTSDHGEAFWEHGIAEHGNGVWNEHLAVPFLLAGSRVAAGRPDGLASQIDVPRTLCALAGVAPDPSWGGIDLLNEERSGPVFAFQCDLRGGRSPSALFAGTRKLVFAPEASPGALELAFDLASDPQEQHDRAASEWARALAEEQRAALLDALRPRFAPAEARPDARSQAELEALGYGGK
jgi:arylsulfatase A-like enzyme